MAIIKLTHGQETIVDEGDLVALGGHRWRAVSYEGHWYAYTTERGRTSIILMHRLLMSAPKGKVVDHINRDSLDNRRANLRLASIAENTRNSRRAKNNTSGYTGVVWNKVMNGWQAQIMTDRKYLYLGIYPTAESAARAYDEKAIEMHGEFASLNFPREAEVRCA